MAKQTCHKVCHISNVFYILLPFFISNYFYLKPNVLWLMRQWKSTIYCIYHNYPSYLDRQTYANIQSLSKLSVNSFPIGVDFCRLLIIFANSLDPDQARQNVGPDLDPNCLTLWWYSWKIFWKEFIFKKNPQTTKKHAKLPACKELKAMWLSILFDQ